MLEYILQMNLEIYMSSKSYKVEDYKDITIEDYNF